MASSRRGGTRAISIGVDLASIRRVVRDLDAIDVKTRARIIKRGMRDWGRLVAKQVRRNISWRAVNTPRATIQKVKTYPKGASAKRIKRIWVGVGVKEGRRAPGKEVRGRFGEFQPGWRAHFYEAGWSPWPKGRPTNFVMDPTGQKRAGNYRGQPASRMRAILAYVRRENRWRRGKRRINGTQRVYITRFIGRAGMKYRSAIPFYIARSAREAIEEVARG